MGRRLRGCSKQIYKENAGDFVLLIPFSYLFLRPTYSTELDNMPSLSQ